MAFFRFPGALKAMLCHPAGFKQGFRVRMPFGLRKDRKCHRATAGKSPKIRGIGAGPEAPAPTPGCYQTRQEFTGYMGCPFVQPNALPNSSKFCTDPLVRQRPGEWGSVSAN